MGKEATCLYCGVAKPKWAKAHVVPRLMGTFANQPTLLRRVCANCDRELGDCEAVLAKCTIEAVLLKHIGIVGRHKHRPSPFRRGHSGQPPIRMTGVVPGYEHKVRTEPIGDSRNVDILPQLVLTDRQGNREEIVIENPGCISLAEWRILLDKCLDGKVKNIDAIGLSDEQFALIVRVLHGIGLTFDLPDQTSIQPFQGTALVRGSVTYDARYFRALAKIAFHYLLVHSQLFDGSEEEFDSIRRFIRYGQGCEGDFVMKGNGPIAYDPSGRDRPPYYGHVLRTDVSLRTIAVRVLLFTGRDYKPDWYNVTLSRKEHPIVLPSEEFGHYYKYLEPEERTQYDGVIETLAVAQILAVPGVSRNVKRRGRSVPDTSRRT
jgi:hypothetical protein